MTATAKVKARHKNEAKIKGGGGSSESVRDVLAEQLFITVCYLYLHVLFFKSDF